MSDEIKKAVNSIIDAVASLIKEATNKVIENKKNKETEETEETEK